MKKSLLLFAALLLGSTLWAQVDQTFVFTDMEGNVVPDGTLIVVNMVEEDDYGEKLMNIPLKVRNNSDQDVFGSVFENIDAMPNGTWSTCVFGQCRQLTKTDYSSKGLSKAGAEEPIATEWLPESGKYATWEAQLQLRVFSTQQGLFGPQVGEEIGQGATVTVRFEYSDPAGVDDPKAQKPVATGYYNLKGVRTSAPLRGLNIVKRADGKVVKCIRK